jgi:rhomboid family GlyGly-CTERM serine protease
MSEGLLGTTGSQTAHPISRIQGMWLLGLLCGVSVLLAMGGERARLAMRYERADVLAGEYWRLITGHLVHGSLAHLLLNVAGLGLIAALFSRDYTLRQWLIVLLVSAMAIDAGFVLFEPQLQWYVGLSGVLHGALAAGAVAWWRHETKPLALALTVGLIGKLTWEQWQGALPLSGDMPVIVDAHLYGAIGGLVGAFGIYLCSQRWSVRRRSL